MSGSLRSIAGSILAYRWRRHARIWPDSASLSLSVHLRERSRRTRRASQCRLTRPGPSRAVAGMAALCVRPPRALHHEQDTILLLPVILASCQSTSGRRFPPRSRASPELPLPHWLAFGAPHFGAPTVSNSDAPNPASLMRPRLSSASICTVCTDGTCSMIMGGQPTRTRLAVTDQSASFIKLRMKGQSDQEDFVYDKTSADARGCPTRLVVNDSKRVLFRPISAGGTKPKGEQPWLAGRSSKANVG